MKVLDLCSGKGGWSSGLDGFDVETLDVDPKFNTTYVADITQVKASDLRGPYDFVMASPPCEGFSVASIGHHWELPGGRGTQAYPKSDLARKGVEIVHAVLALIADINPTHGFVIENPTGMMRHILGFGPGEGNGLNWTRWVHPNAKSPRNPSVTYCTLGMEYRKPTDLWVGGSILEHLELPQPCRTGVKDMVTLEDGRNFRINRNTGLPCHEVARRGAATGVQGIGNYADASLVPKELSKAFARALRKF
jgi:hypothetical protein